MTRAQANDKLEFLETTEEEKAHGLRRIKRRHHFKPEHLAPKNCWSTVEIALNSDVVDFYEGNSEKINAVLRKHMEKEKLGEALLEDSTFIDRLKEKLAA